MRLTVCAVVALLGMLLGGAAEAVPISFGCLTHNNAGNCATGEAQLVATLTDAGSGQVLFTFSNTGPVQSSISDIYFDDGTLIGIASVSNSTGVAFTQWAVPVNLPGADLLTPVFETTKGFSADSDAPVHINGVNPGESVRVLFNLLPGRTFADSVLALNTGELRIGVQMVAFSNPFPHTCDGSHPCGASESFVNRPVAVPEAPVLALLGFGLVAVGLVVRRID